MMGSGFLRAGPGRFRRLSLAALGLFIALIVYVVLAGSVSKALTPRDLKAIAILGADRPCSDLTSFDRQFRCVRFVQRAIQTRVPDMRCAANGQRIEPMDFLERGYGCCFDRARFISKTLEHYGLRTRHVSLYDGTRFGWLAYLVPRVASHATTEVLTVRGWMGVDSNEPFILLTRQGRPVTYAELSRIPRSSLAQQPVPQKFFSLRLMPVYGLYSRHGQFHGPNLPAPEINYPEFIRYNFAGSR